MSEEVQAQVPANAQVPAADGSTPADASLTGQPDDPAAMRQGMNDAQREAAELRSENTRLRESNEKYVSISEAFENDPSFKSHVEDYWHEKPAAPQAPPRPHAEQPARTNENPELIARLDRIETDTAMENLRRELGDKWNPKLDIPIRKKMADTKHMDPAYHFWALVGKQALAEATEKTAVDSQMTAAAAQAAAGVAVTAPPSGMSTTMPETPSLNMTDDQKVAGIARIMGGGEG